MAKKKEYEEPIVEEMEEAVMEMRQESDFYPENAAEEPKEPEEPAEKPKKKSKKPSDIPAGAYIYDHAGSSRILGKTKTPISNFGQTVIIGGASWYKIEDGWVTHGSKNQSTTGGECAMI